MAVLDDAKTYIGAAFGPAYTAWMALTSDDQSRTLVSATRYLDLLPWDGTATGLVGTPPTTTFLAWPRSGVVVNGVAVDSTTVPDAIVKASFELAVLIAADPTVTGKADQGSNIASVGGGGGVAVTFFAPSSARNGTATRLPYVVQQLVGPYLATADTGGVEGGFGQAGSTSSQFSACNRFDLVEDD